MRVADIDGSSTAELLYLTPKGVDIYYNWAVNGWDDVLHLSLLPHVIHNFTTVDVVDVLGIGTSYLVWSSQFPGDADRQMLFLDLMNGRNPHLLNKITNNIGVETRLNMLRPLISP